MRGNWAKTAVVAASLIVALVGLTACSTKSQDADKVNADASSPPSVTTPSVLTSPIAAPKRRNDTARAAVRSIVAAYNYLVATGDDAPFVALSGRDCAYCPEFVRPTKRIYKSGGRVDGGQWTLVRITKYRPPDLPEGLTIRPGNLVAHLKVEEGIALSATGEVKDREPAWTGNYHFSLVNGPDGWKAFDFSPYG